MSSPVLNCPHRQSNIEAEPWSPKPLQQQEFWLVISSDVYMLPLTTYSSSNKLFSRNNTFYWDLASSDHESLSRLQAFRYNYPCFFFIGEDTNSQEGRHLLKTASDFRAKSKAWFHPSSRVVIPPLSQLGMKSSCHLLLCYPPFVAQLILLSPGRLVDILLASSHHSQDSSTFSQVSFPWPLSGYVILRQLLNSLA